MSTAEEEEVRRGIEECSGTPRPKTLDAMMVKIVADAISYEHEALLQYRGVGVTREVCRRGLDAAVGNFR